MTLYVRTEYVPEHSKDYLTVGKLYVVTDLSDDKECGTILCDEGEELFIIGRRVRSHRQRMGTSNLGG